MEMRIEGTQRGWQRRVERRLELLATLKAQPQHVGRSGRSRPGPSPVTALCCPRA